MVKIEIFEPRSYLQKIHKKKKQMNYDVVELKHELMKKVLGETQTLHAGCSKVEPKIFTPPQNLFPVAQDGQNLISWRWSLHSPIDPVW